MNEDFYFKFLEKLADGGIFKSMDVSKELQNHFRNKKDYGDIIWTPIHTYVEEFLDGLKKDEHIEYENLTEKVALAGNRDWISKIKANVNITPKGLLFLYEKKKIDAANNGNLLTKIFIGVTAFFSLLTFIVSIINIKVVVSSDADKTTISQSTIHIQQQQELINKLQLELYKAKTNTPNKPLPHQENK